MKFLVILITVCAYASIGLGTFIAYPDKTLAAEIYIESPRLDVMDMRRIHYNEEWTRISNFDIKSTQDQSLSAFFGILGGVSLFCGIMLSLFVLRPFIQNRFLLKLWRPLRLVLW